MSMILALIFTGANALIFLLKFSTALDNISSSESMGDGKTLVSRDGTFELGFFMLVWETTGGGFETLREVKHTVLFQQQETYK